MRGWRRGIGLRGRRNRRCRCGGRPQNGSSPTDAPAHGKSQHQASSGGRNIQTRTEGDYALRRAAAQARAQVLPHPISPGVANLRGEFARMGKQKKSRGRKCHLALIGCVWYCRPNGRRSHARLHHIGRHTDKTVEELAALRMHRLGRRRDAVSARSRRVSRNRRNYRR